MTESTTTSFTPNRKVLYVDDEAHLLSSFASLLKKKRVETLVLQDSQKIESVLFEHGPFAAVFSDQRMPVVDGVAVLEKVARFHPDTIRILVTGYADYADTIRAINVGGISHFIAKPWKDDELRKLVGDTISRFNLAKENAFLLDEIKRANADLQELLDGTVTGTVQILRDMLTYGHPSASSQVERIRKLGLAFLEMSPDISALEQWEIRQALNLFNFGLALLPPSPAKRETTPLTPEARNHTTVAAELLKDIPRFEGVARIVLLQHKNFDGTGSPANVAVAGKTIPLGSRLLRILLDLDVALIARKNGRSALETMSHLPSKYDTDIIARMLGVAPSYQDSELPQETTCNVHEFRPGMVVLEDIVTQSGKLLLKSGFSLTETSLKILLQWHNGDPVSGEFRVRLSA
ncbi:MAG: response regulator [Bacteroidetes bacterium]|nr:response regulator [Bacteroidota bacterium]MCW5895632.1 response regulator [Bacteroidota bacterium]